MAQKSYIFEPILMTFRALSPLPPSWSSKFFPPPEAKIYVPPPPAGPISTPLLPPTTVPKYAYSTYSREKHDLFPVTQVCCLFNLTWQIPRRGKVATNREKKQTWVSFFHTTPSFIVSTRWKKGVRTCLFLFNTPSPIYGIEGFLKQFLKAFFCDQHSTQKLFSKAFESAALFDFFITSLFVRLALVL